MTLMIYKSCKHAILVYFILFFWCANMQSLEVKDQIQLTQAWRINYLRLRIQLLFIGDVAKTNWSLQDTVVYNQSTKAKPLYPKYNFYSQNNRYGFLRSNLKLWKDSFIFLSMFVTIHFSFNTSTHLSLSLSLFLSRLFHFHSLSLPNFPENLSPPRTPLVFSPLDRPLGSDSLFISINALHLNLTERSWAFGNFGYGKRCRTERSLLLRVG